ncbi:class I SAM-dependent methyltransferase [Edaphobacter sp.]|uniref:class I SAM-dependent methyltransferase n=1 Tax=Edaphobacter sp. TaxID=1934404 RepID=UPI002DB942F7|nr:class I SAM-dependent methyltransferase [Edaphobacter sp.]HEU5341487.1 class I SAM-dependent methyltransferase [Edaphobacter sp.]
MSDVQDHYSNLLAKQYTWMFGMSFSAKVAEQKAILADALQPATDDSGLGLAVDLGSGPGFQTIALSEMGCSPVLALDTSESLLKELQLHQKELPVQTICADLLQLGQFVSPASANAIVCMGDTITHLGTRDAVEGLLGSVFDALVPGGRFVISYRDLSAEATGLDRFIPVYADEDKVMTCFLEFDRTDTVMVHDLVYSRVNHQWLLEKSNYRKLRLPIDWLNDAMVRVGFIVHKGQAGRLLRLVGQKPQPR